MKNDKKYTWDSILIIRVMCTFGCTVNALLSPHFIIQGGSKKIIKQSDLIKTSFSFFTVREKELCTSRKKEKGKEKLRNQRKKSQRKIKNDPDKF